MVVKVQEDLELHAQAAPTVHAAQAGEEPQFLHRTLLPEVSIVLDNTQFLCFASHLFVEDFLQRHFSFFACYLM